MKKEDEEESKRRRVKTRKIKWKYSTKKQKRGLTEEEKGNRREGKKGKRKKYSFFLFHLPRLFGGASLSKMERDKYSVVPELKE
jgi:hypothetical protein